MYMRAGSTERARTARASCRQRLPYDVKATGRHIRQLVKELLRDLLERLRIEHSDSLGKRAERSTPDAKALSHLVEGAGLRESTQAVDDGT